MSRKQVYVSFSEQINNIKEYEKISIIGNHGYRLNSQR